MVDYQNSETTHRSIIENLSQDQISHIKGVIQKIWVNLSPELQQLYTNLKQSEVPIYDGVLIRILTDAGYVSVYSVRGYLSVNLSWSITDLNECTSLERKESLNHDEENSKLF